MPDDLRVTARAIVDRAGEMWHVGDVPWWEAPLPRRWHRCQGQTSGFVGHTYVQRCACGAISIGFGGWRSKNQRRRKR